MTESLNILLTNSDENRKLIINDDRCDKYDYLLAISCGAIGGLIDIFLVGSPQDSKLVKWTDKQVDNTVKGFAKLCGWKAKGEKSDNIASAIGFLEKKFKVNYDHRHSADVSNQFKMSTKNHHMKSLGHSPDIIGLFFSVLNQFTSTSTFIADGKLITVDTEKFELQGNNFISKIFCGIVNWFGHIMSDIAGSSGSRGNLGRGSGVPMPFYELFGLCKFGKFNVGKDKQDLATIATRAFEEGYDARFAIAMAIPVIITELSIRLIWTVRRYFQYKKPLNECIPTTKHADLRVMLLFGHATLCVLDLSDAFLKSGGNALLLFMRFNLVAWSRLGILVFKELCIRIGIPLPMQTCIESFRRINTALLSYLEELKKIDIEAFKVETDKYNNIITTFDKVEDNETLNKVLVDIFKDMGIKEAWQGDFNEHMSNKSAKLVFE